MVLLAVLSIVLLGVFEFQDLTAAQERQLLYVDLGIVAIFWIEYLQRLAKATRKGAFVRQNWYELPGMVPIFPGMEGLSGARLFRLLRLLRILRLLGVLTRFDAFTRVTDRFIRQNKLGYVGLLALVVILGGAALAWLFEPAEFPTYWDAVWWAVVTAFTVGYGDYAPESTAGRVIGIFLMLLGIGLIGTLAGTLSSFLTERHVDKASDETPAAAASGLVADLERLARLRDEGKLTEHEFDEAKRRLLAPAAGSP